MDHMVEQDSAPPAPSFTPQQLAAHLWKHSEALEALETSIRGSRRLESLCRDFELQKVCYLPLNTFLLRPLHRLMHYKQVLERLCKHHPPSHADFRDCRGECGLAGTLWPQGSWSWEADRLFRTWSNIFFSVPLPAFSPSILENSAENPGDAPLSISPFQRAFLSLRGGTSPRLPWVGPRKRHTINIAAHRCSVFTSSPHKHFTCLNA